MRSKELGWRFYFCYRFGVEGSLLHFKTDLGLQISRVFASTLITKMIPLGIGKVKYQLQLSTSSTNMMCKFNPQEY